MTESVWVVVSVEGERIDVLGVADSEEHAEAIGEASGTYYSVEHYPISHGI